MWKNICHYSFSSLLTKSNATIIKTSFVYTNYKNQNEKFLWLGKSFASSYFASLMALKTKAGSAYALIRHLFLFLLCVRLQKPKRQASVP